MTKMKKYDDEDEKEGVEYDDEKEDVDEKESNEDEDDEEENDDDEDEDDEEETRKKEKEERKRKGMFRLLFNGAKKYGQGERKKTPEGADGIEAKGEKRNQKKECKLIEKNWIVLKPMKRSCQRLKM